MPQLKTFSILANKKDLFSRIWWQAFKTFFSVYKFIWYNAMGWFLPEFNNYRQKLGFSVKMGQMSKSTAIDDRKIWQSSQKPGFL